MRRNQFNINPSTSEEINKSLVASGYGTVDCNYDRVYKTLKNSSNNFDKTNNKPILKAEFVYLPNFPSKVINYEQMVKYGKDKYYWDTLNQKLYKFKVQPSVAPFVKQHQVIVGTEGSPTQAISILNEFSKSDGIFKEVFLDTAISTYIVVHGHPEQYAERPYKENTYYYDDVHDKYYNFISNYTINKDNWYYDKTLEDSSVLKYLYDLKSWTTVNTAVVLEGSPNDLIKITDDYFEESDDNEAIDIDNIDQSICYCDRITDTLYMFDYGRYFVDIVYSGTIYERPFEFYRNICDVFLDINSTKKIKNKDIYYISGHPKKVKSPSENRYYYDSKNQIYYEHNKSDNSWHIVKQDNILIPQTMFPYTNGPVQKEVTLTYYHITDCYTKKEVDNLMPVIPGYISAFENDKGYIFEHQDISGKQDNLSKIQLNTLNSGINASKVNSYNNYMNTINNKESLLTEDQLAALNSGITPDLVSYFDGLNLLINTKATKSNTLSGYGITDAYSEYELEQSLNNLINKLNNG